MPYCEEYWYLNDCKLYTSFDPYILAGMYTLCILVLVYMLAKFFKGE